MTSQQTIRVHTTGVYAGKTVTLGGHRFVNGVAEFTGSQEELQPLLRKLARGWQAYPEGSEELAALQEQGNGERGTDHTASQPRPDESVQRDGESRQQGSVQESEHVGGEHAEAQAGDTGGVSGGHGHSNSGLSEQHSSESGAESSVNPQLARIVYDLDPDNDNHWTQTGKPALSAVTEGYGSGDVTRSDVNKAAPGWNRDKAREYAVSQL